MLTRKRSQRTFPSMSGICDHTCSTMQRMENWASWAGIKPKGCSRHPASKSAQPAQRQACRAAACMGWGVGGLKEPKKAKESYWLLLVPRVKQLG